MSVIIVGSSVTLMVGCFICHLDHTCFPQTDRRYTNDNLTPFSVSVSLHSLFPSGLTAPWLSVHRVLTLLPECVLVFQQKTVRWPYPSKGERDRQRDNTCHYNVRAVFSGSYNVWNNLTALILKDCSFPK